MNRIRIIFLTMLVATMGIGAACFNAKTIKSALDVAQIACIFVNDYLDDANQLSKACNIAEDYLPEVRHLISARKEAMAQKAAMAARSNADAGSADAMVPAAGDTGTTASVSVDAAKTDAPKSEVK